LPFVWSPDCLRHDPDGEVWVGVRLAGTEVPERAEVLRAALLAAGAEPVVATTHDDTGLAEVHDRAFLEHLAGIHAAWLAAGFAEDPGQDRVVPYVFPTPAMALPEPDRVPAAVHARAGRWCYDTMTLVGPGTWPAARAAVDVALTAVDLVGRGAPVAYGLCRPPGHHATRAGYGGSCYLNNAAVAATGLRRAGFDRVAIIDIDAHHGNGTQSIFYDRADVYYGSLHVDPGAGWFPHFVGFGHERGAGAALGANRNVPLAPGSGDAAWLGGLAELAEEVAAWRPGAVVLSLGVDAAGDDPESPLQVTVDGYRQAGRLIAGLGVPVVAVQEGGYHLATLGRLAVAALAGVRG
jgi:acetoin utilization deacetylase AcuC-like enzyme